MRLSWLPLTTAKANGSAVVKLFNLSLSLSLLNFSPSGFETLVGAQPFYFVFLHILVRSILFCAVFQLRLFVLCLRRQYDLH